MSSDLGKLEGMFTVPTGGLTLSQTDGDGGPTTRTLAAGTYYLTELLAAMKTLLDAGGGVTYTITVDGDADAAHGQVTIVPSSGTFSISWTSTALRDALGFSADIAAAATATGAKSSPYIYLPNVRCAPGPAPHGHRGVPSKASSTTRAPSGESVGIDFGEVYDNELIWAGVYGFKLWEHTWPGYTAIANESFEVFWKTVVGASKPFRYFPDRTDDTTYRACRAKSPSSFREMVSALEREWTSGHLSPWQIVIPVLEYTG